jgi:hypothetical protein
VEVEDEGTPVEDAEPAEEAVEDEEAAVEAVEDERSPDYVAPALKPPRPAGIMTAAEIAGDVDEPEPEAESAAEPESAKSAERVVYVYVDENGVEHEVSEDELGDFEIVDGEDEES